ncbi:hypothetical protein HUU40_24145, partial [candidate division KSB1 bacterium]|nr:hypothetical protein [candidate division KSB1 bacterium]
MSSLVLELQQDALDSSVSVSDLLRKAFVVAKKLAIQEFYDWIDLELNGYTDVNKIPPYRIITGKIVSWNPYYGWIPVRNNPQIDEMLSQRAITQSIGEIDKLINNGSSFEVPFDKEIELLIMRGSNIQLKPTLKIDITQLHKILEGVRNIVLKWSLRLESDGILGRGLSFSKKEKQI